MAYQNTWVDSSKKVPPDHKVVVGYWTRPEQAHLCYASEHGWFAVGATGVYEGRPAVLRALVRPEMWIDCPQPGEQPGS